MANQADEINEQEKQMRNEMLFTLSERDRGTLAMVVTPNEWKRKELYNFLKEHLKEYNFFDLDLTTQNYTSLHRALQTLLPQSVLQSEPVQYLVSVTGLESSLYKTEDGKIEFSSLVAQLNFERELIFNQPYIILLWVSEGFDRELKKKAPDLMHWMSKRFVFEDNGSDGMEVAEAEIEYGPVRKKGKTEERLERIRQLEETWARLCLHNEDQVRLVKDKINLLRLMGKEYAAAFYFQKAEDAFKKAIALNNKIEAELEVELFYEFGFFYYSFDRYESAIQCFQKSFEFAEKDRRLDLGNIYHAIGLVNQKQRKWPEAIQNYLQALKWGKKTGNEYAIGTTYHQIGRVYEEQRKWSEAIQNYLQALEWKKKAGNEYATGGTYHQIGMVYAAQRKWSEAIQNYQEALYWYKKAGNEYVIGSTYHQIGRVYQVQRRWSEALQNYQQALEWKRKLGNEYAIGSTYHQIGMVYVAQRKWEDALLNFQKALEWKEKSDNQYALGNTYRQIGRLNEQMRKYEAALDSYQKALEIHTQFDHPNLSIARESVERIQKKIFDQQSSDPQPPTT